MFTCHALLRAVLDHIPPFFQRTNFADKKYMKQLVDFRNQANDVLHRHASDRSNLIDMQDMPPRVCVNTLLQSLLSRL